MEEDEATGVLNSLGLGAALGGMGFGDDDSLDALRQMGLVSGKGGKMRASDLERGPFADGDGGDDDDNKYDDAMEAELNREFAEEERLAAEARAAAGPSAKRVRGEEDDYDFDEEDAAADKQGEPADQSDDDLFGGDADGSEYDPGSDVDMKPVAGAQTQPQQQQQQKQQPLRPTAEEQQSADANLVKQYYPAFDPAATLNFTDLLAPRTRDDKRKKAGRGPVQIALPPPSELSEAPSTRDLGKNAAMQPITDSSRLAVLSDLIGDMLPKAPIERDALGMDADRAYAQIAANPELAKQGWMLPPLDQHELNANIDLEPWEDRVVWGGRGDVLRPPRQVNGVHESGAKSKDSIPYTNQELVQGDWTRAIIWDDRTPHQPFARLEIFDNDPNLVKSKLSAVEEGESAAPSAQPAKKRRLPLAHLGQQLDTYNLSNDRVYESLKEKKRVVRQTFGNLEVQHAWPALKLQLPYYRTSLTKSEARSYHRPSIQFPQSVPLTFSKVRTAKKKGREQKPTGAAAGPALGPSRQRKNDNPVRNLTELSLKDTTPYVLTEFSEEYPPIMSNMGMGSILVNYYRKAHAKDEHIPKLDLGEAFILDDKDETPFNRFGSVRPGEVVPTLYNNLVRAPLFKHQASPRDYLVVKTTVGSTTSYYIREIKNLYVVGQTFPQTEVPGPHSRKVTNMLKLRLQAIAARVCDHNENHRVKIHKLIRYFPDSTELQMRQKLKDFMEYVRRGHNQGFWMMKPDSKGFEEVMREVKPEDVVLSEAMLVGQRHLLDAGYGKGGEEIDMNEEDESKMDIEQQLAPWITTKNFLNATQNKAMLKLYGEGDPTGRGEGYNFVRVSMKDIFLREGETMDERIAEMQARPKSSHKYNVAEQQEIYKEEIERIWRLQQSTLRSKKPPILTKEDQASFEKAAREQANLIGAAAAAAAGAAGAAENGSASPGSQDPNKGPEKVLRIRRTDRWGQVTTEIVKDPNVYNAYMLQRELLEEENMNPEDLAPGADPMRNERMKKKLEETIANMKHNQDRRMQRKNAKPGPDGKISGGGGSRNKSAKGETTRKCGNCGAVGHMKTNKNCPRYLEFYTEDGKKRDNPPPPAVSNTPGPSAGSPKSTAPTPAPGPFSPAASATPAP